MSSDDYDYFSLASGRKSYNKKASRLWRFGCLALLIFNGIVLVIYLYKTRQAPNPLDNFQQLNNGSLIDMAAVPSTLPQKAITLNPDDHAVVSSLYTDSYVTAITTLGHSLKAANVTARMILVYIPNRLSPRSLCLATAAGWTLHSVPFIPPPHKGKGVYRTYKDQYTKLNLWTLDSLGIKSLVYLDADTLVRRNFDELFILPFNFAAVPDVFLDNRGFGVGFNAGVLFLRPSTTVFKDMISKLDIAEYPPRFAEQAFLNVYFGGHAARLPYAYNANMVIKQRSPKLWETMQEEMRIIHYTWDKPFPVSVVKPKESLEKFFDSRIKMKGGIWAEEMIWWQDAWREMKNDMQEPDLRC